MSPLQPLPEPQRALKVDTDMQKQSSAKTKGLPRSTSASSTTLYSNERGRVGMKRFTLEEYLSLFLLQIKPSEALCVCVCVCGVMDYEAKLHRYPRLSICLVKPCFYCSQP